MKILTVCLGNICRSPMAEGVLRQLAQDRGLQITTDSAGTGDYHVGEEPDTRAMACMEDHGVSIRDLRARQFKASDFEEFDLILAMDASNLSNMLKLAPDALAVKNAKLVMDFAPDHALREVPDPYFGGDEGFEEVHDMLMEACNKVLDHVEAQRTQ